MGYQIITWPMTSRDPQKCCDAVRSAILATAWLLVVYCTAVFCEKESKTRHKLITYQKYTVSRKRFPFLPHNSILPVQLASKKYIAIPSCKMHNIQTNFFRRGLYSRWILLRPWWDGAAYVDPAIRYTTAIISCFISTSWSSTDAPWFNKNNPNTRVSERSCTKTLSVTGRYSTNIAQTSGVSWHFLTVIGSPAASFKRPLFSRRVCVCVSATLMLNISETISDSGFMSNTEPIEKCLRSVD